jgi:hypothetical protein
VAPFQAPFAADPEPLAGDLDRLRVDVDADELAPEGEGCDPCGRPPGGGGSTQVFNANGYPAGYWRARR